MDPSKTQSKSNSSPTRGYRRAYRTTREEAAEKTPKTALILPGSLFLLSVGIIGLFVSSYVKSSRGASTDTSGEFPATIHQAFAKEKPSAGDEEEVEIESLGMYAAEKLVSAALLARDEETLANYYRLGDRSTPASALAEFRKVREHEGKVSSIKWLGSRFVGETLVEEVHIRSATDGEPHERLAQIFQQPDGKWKIDFDSFVRHTSHSWEDILSHKTDKAMVRVLASKFNYYNGEFSDDSVWHSYKLLTPDTPDAVYAYVKAHTPQDIALRTIFSTAETSRNITLEISTSPDKDSSQFIISRVLAENWIVTDEIFDQSF
ncbi:hypothetical protein ACFSSA_05910 [Luteolibacter algae]|uniref:Uncharacterized protein n=1 Tax=Luteolibacter algae TaxID=454151 RepID=A0ABW5D843_9BACT